MKIKQNELKNYLEDIKTIGNKLGNSIESTIYFPIDAKKLSNGLTVPKSTNTALGNQAGMGIDLNGKIVSVNTAYSVNLELADLLEMLGLELTLTSNILKMECSIVENKLVYARFSEKTSQPFYISSPENGAILLTEENYGLGNPPYIVTCDTKVDNKL